MNNSVKVLCFSKDRPLQLQAYLASLTSLTSVNPSNISVIVPSLHDYIELTKEFPDVIWINEEPACGFDLALREYVTSLDDNDVVLFGCDDVVYTRPCHLRQAQETLDDNGVIGFSLRLGLNILPRPDFDLSHSSPILMWEWPLYGYSHWNYCFELMASMYKGKLIKEIVKSSKIPIPSPNHLESHGVNYCWNHKKHQQPFMAMYKDSNYANACDVNRVQNFFQNKYNGTEQESPEVLKEKFKQGYRLDWKSMYGIMPSDCFLGNQIFKLVKTNQG